MSEPIAEPVADEAAVAAAEPVAETEPVVEAAPETATDWRSDPEALAFLESEVDARLEARLAQWNANGQAGAQPTAENEPQGIDFFADDAGDQFSKFMQQREEAMLGKFEQIVSPMLSAYQREQEREGSELIKDTLEAIDVGGDFDREAATELFHLYKGESIERYGQTNRALEHAAERAARRQRAIEETAEKRGAEKYKNHMETLGGAPHESGVRQAGQTIPLEGGDEYTIAANFRPS